MATGKKAADRKTASRKFTAAKAAPKKPSTKRATPAKNTASAKKSARSSSVDPQVVEERFLAAVEHHLDGLRTKAKKDFSTASFNKELKDLSGDPVYSNFGLNSPEYVLVRLVGRMSIAIGRRLGEIYDKMARFVAAARFNVTPEQVAEKFDGLQLDVALRYNDLNSADRKHLKAVIEYLGDDPLDFKGIGIEIRYNFNPNDKARLEKDAKVATLLKRAGLLPVYLIYSSISPRAGAIAFLTRKGWLFLQGREASDFTTALFAIDFMATIEKKKFSDKIKADVCEIMESIFGSDAFERVAKAKPVATGTATAKKRRTAPVRRPARAKTA